MKKTLLKVFTKGDSGCADLRVGAKSYEGTQLVQILSGAAQQNPHLFSILMQTVSHMLSAMAPDKREKALATLKAAAARIGNAAEHLDENLTPVDGKQD